MLFVECVLFECKLNQVSLLEDVPQTIVVMYYLGFLYADNGYYCHEAFTESPSLQKMFINPQDDILTILFDNPSIAFATAASMAMVIFKGIMVAFTLLKEFRRELKKEDSDCAGDGCFAISVVVFIVIVIGICYALMLLMPMAAVSYYDIAPSFNKTWEAAFIIFVAGCVSWGLMCCACACVLVFGG